MKLKMKCLDCDKIFFKNDIRSNEIVVCPHCGSYFIHKAIGCKMTLEDK